MLRGLGHQTLKEVHSCFLSFDEVWLPINLLLWPFNRPELDTLEGKRGDEGFG